MGSSDEKKQYDRQYYLTHRDVALARAKLYGQSHQEQIKSYQAAHREQRSKVYQTWRSQLREAVLQHYGNGKIACVRCGFDDIRALTIDHINGGGTSHRREISKQNSRDFHSWLRMNNYPQGYQTLCHNCQHIKQWENKEWGIVSKRRP